MIVVDFAASILIKLNYIQTFFIDIGFFIYLQPSHQKVEFRDEKISLKFNFYLFWCTFHAI